MFDNTAAEAATIDAQIASLAAKDAKLAAFAAAKEAATIDASFQAGVVVHAIDRSAVAVPSSFALDAERFFVVDPSIVYLSHPQGQKGASPKWSWGGGVRKNQFVAIGPGPSCFFAVRVNRITLPGYDKLWAVERQRARFGKIDDDCYCDLLVLCPWPVLFTDAGTAKITAQLCHSAKANENFMWVPVAKDIGPVNPHSFNGEN